MDLCVRDCERSVEFQMILKDVFCEKYLSGQLNNS